MVRKVLWKQFKISETWYIMCRSLDAWNNTLLLMRACHTIFHHARIWSKHQCSFSCFKIIMNFTRNILSQNWLNITSLHAEWLFVWCASTQRKLMRHRRALFSGYQSCSWLCDIQHELLSMCGWAHVQSCTPHLVKVNSFTVKNRGLQRISYRNNLKAQHELCFHKQSIVNFQWLDTFVIQHSNYSHSVDI